MNKLKYITYQTFPANTANSLQTISNLVGLANNNVNVELFFPLREKFSNDQLSVLQDFYKFNSCFKVIGVKHSYPHGRFRSFPRVLFHISHYLWAKKIVKKNFKNDQKSIFFTRSDWVLYFLAKQGSNVTFECHQTSSLRDRILKKIQHYENVKIIFLNKHLKENYNLATKSIILQNGVDEKYLVLSRQRFKKPLTIIFTGNISRFNKSRGLGEVIEWFKDNKLSNNYKLEIIGGSLQDIANLENKIEKINLNNIVKITPWSSKDFVIKRMQKSSIGLMINSPENLHSYYFTSPLKYFEYLYSGLKILAVDFPAHKSLPLNKYISFFEYGNKESFIEALKNIDFNQLPSQEELKEISIETRAKKIIEFIF